MTNKLEHYLFRNYSIAVKQFLIDTCYLSRYPDDQNVGVYYTTPPRAFANFISPAINGQQLNPLVTFDLSSQERADNQSANLFVDGYVRNQDGSFNKHKHPLTYMLTYRVTIWTTKQSDMDILLYQIASSSPKERKYYTKVDTQWMELWSDGLTKETQLEPGDAQDIIHRYGLNLFIPRAYLPLEYVLHRNGIDSVEFTYEYDV